MSTEELLNRPIILAEEIVQKFADHTVPSEPLRADSSEDHALMEASGTIEAYKCPHGVWLYVMSNFNEIGNENEVRNRIEQGLINVKVIVKGTVYKTGDPGISTDMIMEKLKELKTVAVDVGFYVGIPPDEYDLEPPHLGIEFIVTKGVGVLNKRINMSLPSYYPKESQDFLMEILDYAYKMDV